jgi:hypothetical protein
MNLPRITRKKHGKTRIVLSVSIRVICEHPRLNEFTTDSAEETRENADRFISGQIFLETP